MLFTLESLSFFAFFGCKNMPKACGTWCFPKYGTELRRHLGLFFRVMIVSIPGSVFHDLSHGLVGISVFFPSKIRFIHVSRHEMCIQTWLSSSVRKKIDRKEQLWCWIDEIEKNCLYATCGSQRDLSLVLDWNAFGVFDCFSNFHTHLWKISISQTGWNGHLETQLVQPPDFPSRVWPGGTIFQCFQRLAPANWPLQISVVFQDFRRISKNNQVQIEKKQLVIPTWWWTWQWWQSVCWAFSPLLGDLHKNFQWLICI